MWTLGLKGLSGLLLKINKRFKTPFKLRIEKNNNRKECQNSIQRKKYKLQHKTENKLTAINLQSL